MNYPMTNAHQSGAAPKTIIGSPTSDSRTPEKATSTFSANGALTYWSIKTTPFHIIEQIFKDSGFPDYCPPKRSPVGALKLATKTLANFICPDLNHNIVPRRVATQLHKQPKITSYDIFEVQNNSHQLSIPTTMKPLVTTTIHEYAQGHFTTKLLLHSSVAVGTQKTLETKLLSEYVHFQDEVDPNDFAFKLVQILRQELHATLMSPRGAIYWVPNKPLDTWRQVKSRINNRTGSSIYLLTVAHDNDLVKAVSASIRDEVTTSVKNLIEHVSDDDLGERALKAKQAAALKLKNRVQEYESILNTTMTGLKDACDLAKSVAAEATLQKQMDKI